MAERLDYTEACFWGEEGQEFGFACPDCHEPTIKVRQDVDIYYCMNDLTFTVLNRGLVPDEDLKTIDWEEGHYAREMIYYMKLTADNEEHAIELIGNILKE